MLGSYAGMYSGYGYGNTNSGNVYIGQYAGYQGGYAPYYANISNNIAVGSQAGYYLGDAIGNLGLNGRQWRRNGRKDMGIFRAFRHDRGYGRARCLFCYRLADFTVNTRISDLSPGAINFAKQLALKTVAGMLAGSAMPAGKKIAAFVKASPDGNEIGVIGHDIRASLWKAVFANALFAHQSELEDDRLNTGTCWDITTFPILFPLSDKLELYVRKTGANVINEAGDAAFAPMPCHNNL